MSDSNLMLRRAHMILSNMALENELHWWEFWKSRWPISHEPLRNDARNLVKQIEEYFDPDDDELNETQ